MNEAMHPPFVHLRRAPLAAEQEPTGTAVQLQTASTLFGFLAGKRQRSIQSRGGGPEAPPGKTAIPPSAPPTQTPSTPPAEWPEQHMGHHFSGNPFERSQAADACSEMQAFYYRQEPLLPAMLSAPAASTKSLPAGSMLYCTPPLPYTTSAPVMLPSELRQELFSAVAVDNTPIMTTLAGSSTHITQAEFLRTICQPGATERDVTELFSCKVSRHKPTQTQLERNYDDIMCALAGCCDVAGSLKSVDQKVRDTIYRSYGHTKDSFKAWFKNRGASWRPARRSRAAPSASRGLLPDQAHDTTTTHDRMIVTAALPAACCFPAVPALPADSAALLQHTVSAPELQAPARQQHSPEHASERSRMVTTGVGLAEPSSPLTRGSGTSSMPSFQEGVPATRRESDSSGATSFLVSTAPELFTYPDPDGPAAPHGQTGLQVASKDWQQFLALVCEGVAGHSGVTSSQTPFSGHAAQPPRAGLQSASMGWQQIFLTLDSEAGQIAVGDVSGQPGFLESVAPLRQGGSRSDSLDLQPMLLAIDSVSMAGPSGAGQTPVERSASPFPQAGLQVASMEWQTFLSLVCEGMAGQSAGGDRSAAPHCQVGLQAASGQQILLAVNCEGAATIGAGTNGGQNGPDKPAAYQRQASLQVASMDWQEFLALVSENIPGPRGADTTSGTEATSCHTDADDAAWEMSEP